MKWIDSGCSTAWQWTEIDELKVDIKNLQLKQDKYNNLQERILKLEMIKIENKQNKGK